MMDPGTVKIFTSRDAPRLRYIAGILLGDIMGISWEIVTDKRKLGRNPVINYSDNEIKGSFKLLPDTLLFETGTKALQLQVTQWKGLPVFFQTPSGSDLPFDIFAASFFLVSRYEEYLPFEADGSGRFSAHSSFSFANGFLNLPVIDHWVKEWTKILITKLHNLVFRKNLFRSVITVDVDQPFQFLGKSVLRNLGGLLKEFGKKDGKTAERYRTVRKGEKDPWDVFDYIFEKIDKSECEAKFFIPVGDRSEYDVQPSWHNEDYRSLIGRISGKYMTGLHPSYYASGNSPKLKAEAERLRKITAAEVTFARFHYLNIKFPSSYSNLIDAGISEDFSLGYHDEPGFRAGIARPFNFYNLIEEKATSLKLYPFQVMDGTLFKYKKLKPDEADTLVTGLIDETRKAGGLFISIWHNTSLLDTPELKDWRRVFENMLIRQQ